MKNHRMRPVSHAAARSSWMVERSRDPDSRMRLEGKVALIVAGAGKDVCSLALALVEKGSNVIILTSQVNWTAGDKLQAQAKAFGRRCVIFEQPEIDRQAAQQIMRQIVERFGRLDVYIDYTGHSFSMAAPLHNNEEKEPSVCPRLAVMKAAFPYMVEAGRG